MTVHLYHGDLPAAVRFTGAVAVDTETMGLDLNRDRLCLVQLSGGDGDAHLVRIDPKTRAENLARVLSDPAVLKIFHFARFDLAMIQKHLGVIAEPVFCTKIASRLTRTNTERHSLKDLCAELLGVALDKEQQTSDWGVAEPSAEQQRYAANDVLYLHRLKEKLEILLIREGRLELAHACFACLNTRAALDVAGWADVDIFAH